MPDPLAAPLTPVRPAAAGGTAPPGFIWPARAFFDDLDAMGMLHNSRYLLLAERASSAFFEGNGWRWEADPRQNPDQFYVIREQWVRYLEPVRSPADVAVEMWIARLGQSSATYAFQIRSRDGTRAHADIRRVQVKVDPETLRPAPWTHALRGQLQSLLRADMP